MKLLASTSVEGLAIALQEGMSSGMQIRSARGIARSLDIPLSTVHKTLRYILHCYPYKITQFQELLFAGLRVRHTFALEFLARLEVDTEWP